jgi:pimeloyl-ACP methyl ester carboxylesterase
LGPRRIWRTPAAPAWHRHNPCRLRRAAAGLDARYDILAPDLPGHAASPPLSDRPTIGAITDALEADLDTLGLGRVHVLGSSVGARIALELAIRGRARSVVAIAPSGLGLPPERAYQGAVMSTARVLMRTIRPMIDVAARVPMGRALLLTNLRAAPWLSSEAEARALREGFAESPDFWQQLWWAVLADVPLGLQKIQCPVVLAHGTTDVMSAAPTLRYLTMVPRSRFQPLFGGGHAPHSDAPGAILGLVRQATAEPDRPIRRRCSPMASSCRGHAPPSAAPWSADPLLPEGVWADPTRRQPAIPTWIEGA